MGVDQTSLDRIRNATFPSARRGYDRHEVEKFLGRLADWLETGGGDESRSDAVKKELERVGQRTGAILAQAEDSAQQIRAEAEDEARGTINSANLQATETRGEAENYATETRTSADRQSREAIEAAQAEARRIVEDANQRREDMEALIGDLIRRREDVIADTEELAGKLSTAVEQHRSEELQLPDPAPETTVAPESQETELAQETELDPEPQDAELAHEHQDTEVAPEPQDTEVAPEPQDTEEPAITTEREIDPESGPEHRADLRT
jgi:DivIVA domain-containing protein